LKKDFEQLIKFNEEITEERQNYLKEELKSIKIKLSEISNDLNSLGKKRMNALSFLKDENVFNKYKDVSNELSNLQSDIKILEQKKIFLHKLQEKRTEIRTFTEEKGRLQTQIETEVEKQNSDPKSLYSSLRLYFSEIVEEVIDRKALLSVTTNQHGHLEFSADILDESGNKTSADLGHTYRKLLCMAFDMALLRAHLNNKAPKFVYHDGTFEALDDRKKKNLLSVMHQYIDAGIQFIITLIDSDIPISLDDDGPIFKDSEIVLRLHDEGDEGRLFKMSLW
jgi:uncharacterized protein YydD (DUF2326 family)